MVEENINRGTPAGWAVVSHSFDDDEVPEPFKSIGLQSNNIGASVWVQLSSGAMVAALPTGLWKERANFAFYYAAPGAKLAIPLVGWTDQQHEWDGSDPDAYNRHHDFAIEYFNASV
ncbi:Uncharacterised protein [Mycobacteroides abscessus subsp. bolletii]|uniref:hypothetical protein n=1 Tax=Mycobacteroides abscessus TaxID=36809 RepID=UPI0009A6D452|nr:hypothetical protein [Mycobacteroides abscessus]SKU75245.1 Uncharacterised protein [Mycobacteroides abscessus subsp. bolletii]